eukprot:3363121-Prymnesium_polylepis.1
MSSRSPLVAPSPLGLPSPLTVYHPEAPSLLVAPLPSGSLPAVLTHTSSGLSPSLRALSPLPGLSPQGCLPAP